MGRNGIALVLCVATGVATAQPSNDARKAFERGRAALQTGDYEKACAAFEESYDLEAQPETRFNMALCSEQLGKLATALYMYQELARTETGARRSRSAQAAESLSKRVPRMRIELGNKDKSVPAGFVVTVDGERVTNFKDTPIDIGTHTVMAAASGTQNWQGVAEASWEREIVIVSITLVPGKPGPDILTLKPPKPPPRKKTPPPKKEIVIGPEVPLVTPSRTRRNLGIGFTVGGGAIVVGGLVAGLFAQRSYTAAKDVCGGVVCGDEAKFARGESLIDEARSRGNLATGLVIGGGAVMAAGLVMWLTAPSAEERGVAFAPTTNGVSVFGRF